MIVRDGASRIEIHAAAGLQRAAGQIDVARMRGQTNVAARIGLTVRQTDASPGNSADIVGGCILPCSVDSAGGKQTDASQLSGLAIGVDACAQCTGRID